jgi:hypothetical protein
MTDELERIYDLTEILSRHLTGGTAKNRKNIKSSVPAET